MQKPSKGDMFFALSMVWITKDRQAAIDLGWRWWCHEYLSAEDLEEFIRLRQDFALDEEEDLVLKKWSYEIAKTKILDYEDSVCASK